MAEAAIAGANPLLSGLPDEIVIWEILVRLDPKSLLRCRAVCRAWRCATSARGFLLAHHARQPALPVGRGKDDGNSRYYRSIIIFDHQAADAQLQHVTRLDDVFSCLEASCDGLLLLRSHGPTGAYYSICNPATRQCARLPVLSDFFVFGMYQHHPTSEYRILLYHENQEIVGLDACHIFALGSVQPTRNIGWQQEAEEACYRSVEAKLDIGSNNIIVFDTTTESFQAMHAPVAPIVPCYNLLFEMDGVLGMYCYGDVVTTIDIWVLPDYESEVWTCKCKIELPVTEIKELWGKHEGCRSAVVVPGNGELLVLVKSAEWLFQIDMDGKLVATFHRKEVVPSRFKLKQTLVPHAFFPTLDGNFVTAMS
ncbi:hypothetical protein VPH35_062891 [Triticum aestivum]